MSADAQEECAVGVRHASTGAFCAAHRLDDGALVARSRAFTPHDVAAERAARAELARTLASLGWAPADAVGRLFRRAARGS